MAQPTISSTSDGSAPLSYSSAIAKGTHVLALTLAPTPIPQSPFTSPSLLSTWGYTTTTFDYTDTFTWRTLEMTLPHLISISSSSANSVSSIPIDPVRSRALHDTTVTVQCKHYAPTMALFQSVMHASSGILVAESNSTPATMKNPWLSIDSVSSVSGGLPELSHWSDVAFLQWKSLGTSTASLNNTIPELKVVFRSNIVNTVTQDVCEHIVGKLRAKRAEEQGAGEIDEKWFPTWPGVSFGVEEEEARALCGTPNGKGVLWMLAQHSEELGRKTVDKITLFYGEEGIRWAGETPNLVFWFKDVEKDRSH